MQWVENNQLTMTYLLQWSLYLHAQTLARRAGTRSLLSEPHVQSGSRYLHWDVCRPNALSGAVSGDYSAPGVGK